MSAISQTPMFGYGVGKADSFQSYKWVTFTNCANIELEASANGPNSGILLSHVDFRSPNTNSRLAYEPEIDFGATALGTNQRTLHYVTWSRSNPTASNVGQMFIRGIGMNVEDFIISDYQAQFLSADTILEDGFQAMHVGVPFATAGATPQTIRRVYHYYDGDIAGAHPYSPSSAAPLTVVSSVFENRRVIGLSVVSRWEREYRDMDSA